MEISGSDVCDSDVTLTNNSPESFNGPCDVNGGVTNVIFTATDDVGNSSLCSAKVTVMDTTKPEFDRFELDPSVIWPPNHKMVNIKAAIEVSDISDANPDVTFMSILNSEDDVGTWKWFKGKSDIEANIDTDDRDFFLRAERRGSSRSRRKYTVRYRVQDCSGNQSFISGGVTVPHHQ